MDAGDQKGSAVGAKISVVIPVYNGEAFLARCLTSVFEQSEQRLEIVIVDDASSDSSMRIVENLRGGCPQSMTLQILLHDAPRGCSAARNTGVKAAAGEYLFFVDADDWLTPTCLEELLKLSEAHAADVSCGSFEYYFKAGDNGGLVDGRLSSHVYNSNEELLAGYCKRNIPPFLWNKLIRRDFVDEIDLCCEESITNDEDQLWIFRLVMNACRWVSSDKVTYYYRKNNPSSISVLAHTGRRLKSYFMILSHMNADVGKMGKLASKKSRLVACALLNFTKSILWHIEQDTDADFRKLYSEFQRQNVMKIGGPFYRHINIKYKFFALGWELPYPLCRCFSPYFLMKLKPCMKNNRRCE